MVSGARPDKLNDLLLAPPSESFLAFSRAVIEPFGMPFILCTSSSEGTIAKVIRHWCGNSAEFLITSTAGVGLSVKTLQLTSKRSLPMHYS